MMEPVDIRDALIQLVTGTESAPDTSASSNLLAGHKLLITAGPTQEAIDPVRYISNHSSGKMGFAIAEAAASMGASVTLVAGPVSLNASPAITRLDVISAEEMLDAVLGQVAEHDVFISVAAVADYKLETIKDQKIKKSDDQMKLSLVRNPDILKIVSALEHRPFCLGFAAETQNVEKHARGKLKSKQLDMIAANNVGQADNPVFGSDTNSLNVYWPEDDGHQHIPSGSKHEVAKTLLAILAERLSNP
jgi:phosphopantothenoylcysteine decarboxylase/phosphopantothenate--cysteine ligase